MNTNQKRDFLIEVAFSLFIIAVIYLLYKYILPIALPFIFGFIVAWLVVKTAKRLHSENKWLRMGITILYYLVFGLLMVLLLIIVVSWLVEKIVLLPDLFQNTIIPTLKAFHKEWLHPIIDNLDPDIHSILKQIWDSMVGSLSSVITLITNSVVNFASTTVGSVPTLFISVLMMLISTFFFVVDYEKIVGFYEEQVPVQWKSKVNILKDYLKNTLLVVIRSYILIMLLTFTELSILFTLFGIANPIVLACVIAIFDIMPVLGTGGILIPWSILAFIMGNPILGIKVLLIYGIVTVVRNYVEPKIVGAQLGLHPIITLVSMFLGLRLFGFIGMFGFPITISFIWKNMHKEKEA